MVQHALINSIWSNRIVRHDICSILQRYINSNRQNDFSIRFITNGNDRRRFCGFQMVLFSPDSTPIYLLLPESLLQKDSRRKKTVISTPFKLDSYGFYRSSDQHYSNAL